jgi:hypothetical protein
MNATGASSRSGDGRMDTASLLHLPENVYFLRAPLACPNHQGNADIPPVRSRPKVSSGDLVDAPGFRVTPVPTFWHARVNDQISNCWNMPAELPRVIAVNRLGARPVVALEEAIDQDLGLFHFDTFP